MKTRYFTHVVIMYHSSYMLCTFATNLSFLKTQIFESLRKVVNIDVSKIEKNNYSHFVFS